MGFCVGVYIYLYSTMSEELYRISSTENIDRQFASAVYELILIHSIVSVVVVVVVFQYFRFVFVARVSVGAIGYLFVWLAVRVV